MTQVISQGKRCHVPWCQQNTKKTGNFRIQKVGIQNSGNWISEFRIGKLDRETSEFRELDAIRYAIVFHWFWSVGLSPKTPQAD